MFKKIFLTVIFFSQANLFAGHSVYINGRDKKDENGVIAGTKRLFKDAYSLVWGDRGFVLRTATVIALIPLFQVGKNRWDSRASSTYSSTGETARKNFGFKYIPRACSDLKNEFLVAWNEKPTKLAMPSKKCQKAFFKSMTRFLIVGFDALRDAADLTQDYAINASGDLIWLEEWIKTQIGDASK